MIRRRRFLTATAAGAGMAAVEGAPRARMFTPKPVAKAGPAIDGYVDPLSCRPGERVSFHVSTQHRRFSLQIARLGAGRQVVWQRDRIRGGNHPVPPRAAMSGCDWPPAVTLTVPSHWRSGYYAVRMWGTDNGADAQPRETFFLLRPAHPGREARILFQASTNTFQAYNGWGGNSLYSGPDFPRVSFRRPFAIHETPMRAGGDWFDPNTNCHHTWDEPFIAWAERAGYRIDYCANLDLELHPELLETYRLVLSVGHDEYWSAGMRDRMEAFVANGGNAAFLSGNSVCRQVRLESDASVLVCHKQPDRDPVFATGDRRLLTTFWSDPLIRRTENRLTGVGFSYGGYNGLFGELMSGPGAGEYTVHRPDHWLFAGTGLGAGQRFGGASSIAGYECDGCEMVWDAGLPFATGRDGTPKSFTIVATSPARWSHRDGSLAAARQFRNALGPDGAPRETIDGDGAAVMGLYTQGGTVVTVGSCDWPYGLRDRDPTTLRVVRNILDRLSA